MKEKSFLILLYCSFLPKHFQVLNNFYNLNVRSFYTPCFIIFLQKMGFFDKLKSLKNSLTGNHATVTIVVSDAKLNQPIIVYVQAQAKESDILVSNVYLKIQANI